MSLLQRTRQVQQRLAHRRSGPQKPQRRLSQDQAQRGPGRKPLGGLVGLQALPPIRLHLGGGAGRHLLPEASTLANIGDGPRRTGLGLVDTLRRGLLLPRLWGQGREVAAALGGVGAAAAAATEAAEGAETGEIEMARAVGGEGAALTAVGIVVGVIAVVVEAEAPAVGIRHIARAANVFLAHAAVAVNPRAMTIKRDVALGNGARNVKSPAPQVITVRKLSLRCMLMTPTPTMAP